MKKTVHLIACCLLPAAAQLRASVLPNTAPVTTGQNTSDYAGLQNLNADDLLSAATRFTELRLGVTAYWGGGGE